MMIFIPTKDYLEKKLNDLNLTDYKFEMYDSTTFGNYFQIRIILEQINNN
jgi:hypothetical protein